MRFGRQLFSILSRLINGHVVKRLPVKLLLSLTLGSLFCSTAVYAQIAADSAQNYPATVGSGVWNNGDNFGFGFQPWQFVTTGSAGLFLGDSSENGGNGMGNGGSSGDINSPNRRA